MYQLLGPFWLDILPGVRVEMEPVSPAAFILARETARTILAVEMDDAAVLASVEFTKALVRRGLRRWEGVGDEDGVVIEPTQDKPIKDDAGAVVGWEPGTISRLLGDYSAYESFDREYAAPVLEREAEKKGSSPSRTGSSVMAKATAKGAGKTGAKSAKRARSKSTGPGPTTGS